MKELGSPLPMWLMKPNPRLIRLEMAALDLVEDGKRPEATSKVTKVEGAVTMLDFLGKES